MKISLKKEFVIQKIKAMIRNGELAIGTKLPRGTEFAAALGVSHITLRAALEELAKEGFVSLVHGKGTFITGDGRTGAAGKILIVRDGVHSLRNLSTYILPGFEKRCCELQLLTETVSTDFLKNSSHGTFRSIIRKNGFSAVLIPGGGFTENDPLAALLKVCGVPVLIAHGTANDPERTGFPVMRTNYAGAWDTGAGFLRSCGFKRCAVFSNASFRVKYYSDKEFLSRFEELSFVPDPRLIVSAMPDDPDFESKLEMLLKATPEAIFCGSDFFATRVCQYLAAHKIRVPEDIAVLGFGGYPGGNFCVPALSTVDFQYNAIGEKAAELLSDPRQLGIENFDIFTPHKMLIRESAVPKK